MPRGGARVGAGRPPKNKGETKNLPAPIQSESADEVIASLGEGKLPLDYMLALMNDPNIDESRRDRLAVAAAPYCHPKVGEGGKKEQKRSAASSAGKGKFATAAAPRLVVNNK